MIRGSMMRFSMMRSSLVRGVVVVEVLVVTMCVDRMGRSGRRRRYGRRRGGGRRLGGRGLRPGLRRGGSRRCGLQTPAAWRGIAALRVEPRLAEWRASAVPAWREPVGRLIAGAAAGWSRNRSGKRRHRASARQGSPPTCGEPRCLDSSCAPPCPDLASPRPPLRIPSRLENPRVRGRLRPLARPDYCLPHID